MIIDSHCHLHDAAYSDVRATLNRALLCDVWGVIGVGGDAASNARTLEAAAAHAKSVWPAFGLHPERGELTAASLEAVEHQVRLHHAQLVALGEVGLPWYSLEGRSDAAEMMTRGRERLERLLALATRFDLAVILHAPHGAAVRALEALRRAGVERAVFHWHKAPAEVTRAIVDAGYLVSVTPEVVYRDRDRDLVESVPLDSLLVESDGPWAYGGEFEAVESGPWLASRVAEEVAKIKRLPVDEVMYRISVNTCRVFDLVWN
ncbi:MAG: TatD family hydrolase [Candidatus Rokubacteria bacterium]|nr:TatD family hydrolase [Candidatus Rokubacteria bacterium]